MRALLLTGQVVCFVAMLPGMLAEGALMFFAPRAAKWAGDVLTWPAGWCFVRAADAERMMRCRENRERRTEETCQRRIFTGKWR